MMAENNFLTETNNRMHYCNKNRFLGFNASFSFNFPGTEVVCVVNEVEQNCSLMKSELHRVGKWESSEMRCLCLASLMKKMMLLTEFKNKWLLALSARHNEPNILLGGVIIYLFILFETNKIASFVLSPMYGYAPTVR